MIMEIAGGSSSSSSAPHEKENELSLGATLNATLNIKSLTPGKGDHALSPPKEKNHEESKSTSPNNIKPEQSKEISKESGSSLGTRPTKSQVVSALVNRLHPRTESMRGRSSHSSSTSSLAPAKRTATFPRTRTLSPEDPNRDHNNNDHDGGSTSNNHAPTTSPRSRAGSFQTGHRRASSSTTSATSKQYYNTGSSPRKQQNNNEEKEENDNGKTSESTTSTAAGAPPVPKAKPRPWEMMNRFAKRSSMIPEEPPAPKPKPIRFVLQFGNNSNVVRGIMRNMKEVRFSPAPGDPQHITTRTSFEKRLATYKQDGLKKNKVGPGANHEDEEGQHYFLWTQYKQRAAFNSMASKTHCIMRYNSEDKVEIFSAQKEKRNGEIFYHNHYEGNQYLCTKIGLWESLQAHLKDEEKILKYVPYSFVVKKEADVQEWMDTVWPRFADTNNIWILKPGLFSNRGCGIQISSDKTWIANYVKKKLVSKGVPFLLQKYMETPMLVDNRKFDMRVYAIVDSVKSDENRNSSVTEELWFYSDMYLRTTSTPYSLKNLDNKLCHLNNDAVQKHGDSYGKFEPANKLSLAEFGRYLDKHHKGVEIDDIVQQIKDIVKVALESCIHKLNTLSNPGCFEIYGFDFMIENNYKCKLIEVNTNPCLELCNAYLSTIIPNLIESTLTKKFCGHFGRHEGKWEKLI